MKIERINRFTKEELLVDETIFSVANGYIGTRGSFTEGYGTDFEYNQTYINGFYNFYEYHYEENLTGFPQQGQKCVNIFDGTKIEFVIDNEPLNLSTGELVSLHREYDMSKGVTIRKVHYVKNNKNFFIKESRLVSSKYQDVITIDVELTTTDFTGYVFVRSKLEESHKLVSDKDPRIHSIHGSHLRIIDIDVNTQSINAKTTRSDLFLHSRMIHNLKMETLIDGECLMAVKQDKLSPSNPFYITKHIIHTSNLYDEKYVEKANDLAKIFSEISFLELLKTEEKYVSLFWDNSKVEIPSNPNYEELLNYNIYQLNNQGGESIKHNIAAKGLSGEGYEGHYFWDTEIYMIPFFILTNPEKAKRLLMYRWHTLKQAEREARYIGYTQGVKIPWRTINGEETSPYYPAGSAQFHINSDVAYTIVKYFEATNDIEFMVDYGFEMILETGRFLKEATNFYEGKFHLNSVTGPDEYTTVVDDNFYTNILLQYHFKEIVHLYSTFKDELDKVIKKLHITDKEIDEFKLISENINLPYNEQLKIFVQDKNFLNKEKLDLETIPKENFPMLLNYHPLFLYKHQVLKQADTMLALMLLDYQDDEILRNTFDYYEPITTHDSSLSKCIYSIIAYKLGDYELANQYLLEVLETDYKNIHNNTNHGLHVANLGGSYLGFIYGIAGLRIHRGYINLEPKRTKEFSTYKFSFYYNNFKITVAVDEQLSITTTGKVSLKIFGEFVIVEDTYQCDIK